MDLDEQIGLVSLAFKRKVFFMDFSHHDYSFLTLYRLYLMLLHPLLQLNYRMDPHILRFHRFLAFYTRMNLSFILAFLLVDSNTSNILLFVFLISFLYLPLPVQIYSLFRSRYYLLKPPPLEPL
jgi:hypothetical protein